MSLRSAQAAAQDVGEHGRVAVLGVARCEDQRDDAGPRAAAQFAEPLALVAELGAIAASELLEAVRIVPVPLSQLRARSELAHPLVDGGPLARDASGPDAVDEDPVAVAVGRWFVDALRMTGIGSRSLGERCAAPPLTSSTVRLRLRPFGRLTCTTSPVRAPASALPTGDPRDTSWAGESDVRRPISR